MGAGCLESWMESEKHQLRNFSLSLEPSGPGGWLHIVEHSGQARTKCDDQHAEVAAANAMQAPLKEEQQLRGGKGGSSLSNRSV